MGEGGCMECNMRQNCIVCFPGPTLSEYDDSDYPKSWARVAVNSAKEKVGAGAHIMNTKNNIPPEEIENVPLYSLDTPVLSAFRFVRDELKPEVIFVFGLDFYREYSKYYFHGRRPRHSTENRRDRAYRIKKTRLLMTPRLKKALKVLKNMVLDGFFEGIKVYCVDSPDSQSPFTKITSAEVRSFAASKPKEEDPPEEEKNVEQPKKLDGRTKAGRAAKAAKKKSGANKALRRDISDESALRDGEVRAGQDEEALRLPERQAEEGR